MCHSVSFLNNWTFPSLNYIAIYKYLSHPLSFQFLFSPYFYCCCGRYSVSFLFILIPNFPICFTVFACLPSIVCFLFACISCLSWLYLIHGLSIFIPFSSFYFILYLLCIYTFAPSFPAFFVVFLFYLSAVAVYIFTIFITFAALLVLLPHVCIYYLL